MRKRFLLFVAGAISFLMTTGSVLVLLMAVRMTTVDAMVAMIPTAADRESRAVETAAQAYFFDAGVSDNRVEFPRVDIAPGMVNVAVLPVTKGSETMYQFLDPGKTVLVQGYVQIVLNGASVQTDPPLPTGRFGKSLWEIQADGLEIWQGYVPVPTEITAW